MITREQIIQTARTKDPSIGDDAMISTMEHGYWVGGSIYVSKENVIHSDVFNPKESDLEYFLRRKAQLLK